MSYSHASIAQALLEAIGGEEPAVVAGLFSTDVVFDVPGRVGALPWIGRQWGRAAVEAFVSDNRRLLERVRFEVHDILESARGVSIVGELDAKVLSTGRRIETTFAIVLTITNGKISHFLMLEDSFAVSAAATP